MATACGLWGVGRMWVSICFVKENWIFKSVYIGWKKKRTPHAPAAGPRRTHFQQGDSPPSQLPWSLGKKVRSGGFSSHHSSPPNTDKRTPPSITPLLLTWGSRWYTVFCHFNTTVPGLLTVRGLRYRASGLGVNPRRAIAKTPVSK